MKKVLLLLSVATLMSCNSGTNAVSKINESNLEKAEKEAKERNKVPKIQFEETTYDFGKIPYGQGVEHIFKFKNVGDAPLVITNASSSCGCTVPEKPEGAIEPGESGEIKVHFNGSGANEVTKTITITSNSENQNTTLTIKAFVQPAN